MQTYFIAPKKLLAYCGDWTRAPWYNLQSNHPPSELTHNLFHTTFEIGIFAVLMLGPLML